jgi:hypothetical protein
MVLVMVVRIRALLIARVRLHNLDTAIRLHRLQELALPDPPVLSQSRPDCRDVRAGVLFLAIHTAEKQEIVILVNVQAKEQRIVFENGHEVLGQVPLDILHGESQMSRVRSVMGHEVGRLLKAVHARSLGSLKIGNSGYTLKKRENKLFLGTMQSVHTCVRM